MTGRSVVPSVSTEQPRDEAEDAGRPLVVSDDARAIVLGLQLVANELQQLRQAIEESR